MTQNFKLVPVEPTPKMLVAMWEHREKMRGQSENKIARIGYAAMLASAPEVGEAVGADSYIQPVPDHCDRITWRGQYYHLPPSQNAQLEAEVERWKQHHAHEVSRGRLLKCRTDIPLELKNAYDRCALEKLEQLEADNKRLVEALNKCVYAMEHTLIADGQALQVYKDYDDSLIEANALLAEMEAKGC